MNLASGRRGQKFMQSASSKGSGGLIKVSSARREPLALEAIMRRTIDGAISAVSESKWQAANQDHEKSKADKPLESNRPVPTSQGDS